MRFPGSKMAAFCSLLLGGFASVWGIGYGDLAPEFSLVSTTGETHALSQYRGQVVFLSFFGWS